MRTSNELERIIWVLWFQGFDEAPEVVRMCLHSWKSRNPDWQVIELTDRNLGEYVDEASLQTLRGLGLTPQKLANLIRIYLISRHGGVWADATCFCGRPLDKWIHDYMGSGFFAFRFKTDNWLRKHPGLSGITKRAGHKIMANWFLAAKKGNVLATTVYEEHLQFFVRHRFPMQHSEEGRERVARLGRLLNRNPKLAQLWTNAVVVRSAKVFPYFIFHYHFARIVSGNARCRDIWARTPPYWARESLRLIRALVSPITDEQITALREERVPVYKLTWKFRRENFAEGCVLDYLMRQVMPLGMSVDSPARYESPVAVSPDEEESDT
jgi:hypothetical protein